MATFTGQLISATYDAIIKTIDNDAIGSTAKQLTDGLGNVTPLYVSNTQIGIGITPTEALDVSGNIKASLSVIATTFSGDLNGTINTATEGFTQTAGNDTEKIATTAFVQESHVGKPTGSGTGGKIALWSGSGSSTVLTDSSITEESTQYLLTKDIRIFDPIPAITLQDSDSSGSASSGDIQWLDNAASQRAIISLSNAVLGITSKHGGLNFGTNSTPALTIDGSQNAAFTEKVTSASTITTDGGTTLTTKDYVDSVITAQELNFSGTSGTGSVDLDSQTFAVIGTANEIETSAGSQQLQIGLPDDVTIGRDLTVVREIQTFSLDVTAGASIEGLAVTGDSTFSGTVTTNATAELMLSLNTTAANGGYLRMKESDVTKFFIGARGAVSGGTGTGYDIYTAAGNDLRLWTAGATALTIDTSQNSTFAGTITSGAHLINASSSAFGASSVQGVNTDFLVDSGQGYARVNSYHTGGSNIQFLTNATGSTTNSVALELTKDNNANFAGNVGVGNSGIFENPNSYSPVIEIAAAGPVGLILNDTRDTHPMSIANEGAVMNLRYNTTSLLSLEGATAKATFGGNVGIGTTPITSPNSADTSLSIFSGQDCSIILKDAVETWEIYQNDDLQFSFGTTPTTVMTMQRTTGNVGIGIADPISKLHISGQSGTTGLPSLLLYGESPATGQRYGFNVSADQLDISALGTNGGIGFYTGGNASSITQRMRITSGGDFGFNETTITNPYSQTNFTDLNIDGTWGGVISFKLGGTEKGWIGQRSSGNAGMALGASSGQELFFYTDGQNERMKITSSGNTVVYKSLIFSESAYASDYSIRRNSDALIFSGGDTGFYFNRDDNSVTDMYIDGSGNVGIGKTGASLETNGFFLLAGNNSYAEFVRTTTSDVSSNIYISRGNSGNVISFYRNDLDVAVGSISVTTNATSYNSGSSDKRLKKNITNWNENILDKFKDIKPKEFHFNNQDNTEEKQKGYIAQNEVDKFPEAYPLVYNEQAKEDRHLFNPSGMTVYLMKAIQELTAKVEMLEKNCNCK